MFAVQIYSDLKDLFKLEGALNVLAERGLPYDEMYDATQGVEILKRLCDHHGIEFDEDENDWEWCDYLQNKEYEVEQKIKEKLVKQFGMDLYIDGKV